MSPQFGFPDEMLATWQGDHARRHTYPDLFAQHSPARPRVGVSRVTIPTRYCVDLQRVPSPISSGNVSVNGLLHRYVRTYNTSPQSDMSS